MKVSSTFDMLVCRYKTSAWDIYIEGAFVNAVEHIYLIYVWATKEKCGSSSNLREREKNIIKDIKIPGLYKNLCRTLDCLDYIPHALFRH